MQPAKLSIDVISQAIHLFDQDSIAKMVVAYQSAYYRVCGEHPWQALRDVVSLDFSAADTENAMTLPSGLLGILVVRDTERVYTALDAVDTTAVLDVLIPDNTQYRWCFLPPHKTSLAEGKSVVIANGATSVAVANNAAYVGYDLQIGAEPGFYRIGASGAITPTYYGPRMDAGWWRVRPPGTKRMSLVDDSGDFFAGSVKVWYWALPPPIYDESQAPLFDASEAIEIMAIMIYLGTFERREREAASYRDQYTAALHRAIQREKGSASSIVIPKNRDGTRLRFK